MREKRGKPATVRLVTLIEIVGTRNALIEHSFVIAAVVFR